MPEYTDITAITYRDPLESFTDREEILSLFEQFLHSAQPNKLRLLAVKGNSGTGKSFLIFYLTQRICPKLNWKSSLISFSQIQSDFRPTLQWLEDTLKGCVPRQSLQQYRMRCEEYKRRFSEYQTSITIGSIHQSARADTESSLTSVNENIEINLQLRIREKQLRAEMSRALIELAEECQQPICLFIDGLERQAESNPELVEWFWEVILPELVTASPNPLLVVTCGWEWPSNTTIKPLTYFKELTDFDNDQTRSYLEKQGIIVRPTDVFSNEDEELVKAFYELTRGHPLVLGLAITVFNELDIHEQTAKSLQASRPLLNERARVEFLEERLLSRLQEPYRSLLERGPILRYLDQAALQRLLNIETDNTTTGVRAVDDRTYARFLQYPFIKQVSNMASDPLKIRPTFHTLVRGVRLDTLRSYHPQSKEQLHRKMAEYYGELIQAEWQQDTVKFQLKLLDIQFEEDLSDYKRYLIEMLEEQFDASLECLYHALQVEELKTVAFELWKSLIGSAIYKGRSWRSWLLLELLRQLVEEDEQILSKIGVSYGVYYFYYSQFLMQNAYWKNAQVSLEAAAQIFEQEGKISSLAETFNLLGVTQGKLGKLEQELNYFEQAQSLKGKNEDLADYLYYTGSNYLSQEKLDLALINLQRALTLYKEQGEEKSNPALVATNLNHIGLVYLKLSKLDQALDFFEQALTLRKQIGNLPAIAISLNNIGNIYFLQTDMNKALQYYERALVLSEKVNSRAEIAMSLNNIGLVYSHTEKFNEALNYYERSLVLKEQIGNPSEIIITLENIANMYLDHKQWEQALNYFKRALSLEEEVGDLVRIATTLHRIAQIYQAQKEWELALDYFKQALMLEEQADNTDGIVTNLTLIGHLYQSQEKLDQALDSFQKALKIVEEGDIREEIPIFLLVIGSIYQAQGKMDVASSYYERALTFEVKAEDRANIAFLLDKIGSTYQKQGKWQQALKCHEQALVHLEKVGTPTQVVSCLKNLGQIYYMQDKFEQALNYFHKILALKDHIDNPFNIAAVLNNIGSIHYLQELQGTQRKFEQTFRYLRQALALFEKVNEPAEIAKVFTNFGWVYRQRREWKQAIEYYKKASDIYESLGSSFETQLADQLDLLAECYNQVGPHKRVQVYAERAQQIREKLRGNV